MTPKEPSTETFAYGVVEAALARLFEVNPKDQRGWFKARLQNYRRLRLTPAEPGKGKKVSYTFDDAVEWAIALEMAYSRIDPTLAVAVIQANRAALRDFSALALKASRKEDEIFVTVRLQRISDLPVLNYVALSGFRSFGYWLGDNDDGTRRAVVFNLTARLRALRAALAEVSKPKLKLSKLAKAIVAAHKRQRGEL